MIKSFTGGIQNRHLKDSLHLGNEINGSIKNLYDENTRYLDNETNNGHARYGNEINGSIKNLCKGRKSNMSPPPKPKPPGKGVQTIDGFLTKPHEISDASSSGNDFEASPSARPHVPRLSTAAKTEMNRAAKRQEDKKTETRHEARSMAHNGEPRKVFSAGKLPKPAMKETLLSPPPVAVLDKTATDKNNIDLANWSDDEDGSSSYKSGQSEGNEMSLITALGDGCPSREDNAGLEEDSFLNAITVTSSPARASPEKSTQDENEERRKARAELERLETEGHRLMDMKLKQHLAAAAQGPQVEMDAAARAQLAIELKWRQEKLDEAETRARAQTGPPTSPTTAAAPPATTTPTLFTATRAKFDNAPGKENPKAFGTNWQQKGARPKGGPPAASDAFKEDAQDKEEREGLEHMDVDGPNTGQAGRPTGSTGKPYINIETEEELDAERALLTKLKNTASTALALPLQWNEPYVRDLKTKYRKNLVAAITTGIKSFFAIKLKQPETPLPNCFSSLPDNPNKMDKAKIRAAEIKAAAAATPSPHQTAISAAKAASELRAEADLAGIDQLAAAAPLLRLALSQKKNDGAKETGKPLGDYKIPKKSGSKKKKKEDTPSASSSSDDSSSTSSDSDSESQTDSESSSDSSSGSSDGDKKKKKKKKKRKHASYADAASAALMALKKPALESGEPDGMTIVAKTFKERTYKWNKGKLDFQSVNQVSLNPSKEAVKAGKKKSSKLLALGDPIVILTPENMDAISGMEKFLAKLKRFDKKTQLGIRHIATSPRFYYFVFLEVAGATQFHKWVEDKTFGSSAYSAKLRCTDARLKELRVKSEAQLAQAPRQTRGSDRSSGGRSNDYNRKPTPPGMAAVKIVCRDSNPSDENDLVETIMLMNKPDGTDRMPGRMEYSGHSYGTKGGKTHVVFVCAEAANEIVNITTAAENLPHSNREFFNCLGGNVHIIVPEKEVDTLIKAWKKAKSGKKKKSKK